MRRDEEKQKVQAEVPVTAVREVQKQERSQDYVKSRKGSVQRRQSLPHRRKPGN